MAYAKGEKLDDELVLSFKGDVLHGLGLCSKSQTFSLKLANLYEKAI